MFSSCSGPGPTFGRCCAHWSLGETRSGRRLPASPHACECEALDRGNKGSKMRTVSFLVSSSQDMDHTGVWPSVRAVRSAVRGPPTRRWYRVPALLRCSFLVLPVTSDSKVKGEERCRTACGGFFHSEQQKTCRFDRSCISWSVVYLIASKNIEVYPIFSFDWDFSTIHTLHFPFVIPLFDY